MLVVHSWAARLICARTQSGNFFQSIQRDARAARRLARIGT
jgi:hypothetical protein